MWAWKADYSILRMARLLKVSRAGYYAWVKRLDAAPGVRAQRQEELDVLVRASHDASGGVYGAPRVHADLVADGWSVDRKTVAASMRRQGLEGVSPRAFRPVTTIPGADTHAISDSCERQWDQGDINAVWASDIPPQVGGAPTYLRTTAGFVYLHVVMDAHSRRACHRWVGSGFHPRPHARRTRCEWRALRAKVGTPWCSMLIEAPNTPQPRHGRPVRNWT